MKRGAEKQITREQGSDDEEDQETSSGGFKKADEATLSSRPMRGLPKRAAAAPALAAPTNGLSNPTSTASSTPKFGGFPGFGVPSSSDFTFKPAAPAQTTAPSLFSNPPISTTSTSATAKAISSFLSPPAKSAASVDVEMSQPSNSNAESDSTLKYYTSLRGLNVSFISAATKATDGDPFFDLATMLTQYQSLRSGIQKEFDASSSSASAAKPEPTTKSTAMPTPPASFSTFAPPSSTSSSTPVSGGFTPTLSSTTSNNTKSGFSFPSTSAPAKPAFSLPSSTPSATPSSSLFSGFSSKPTTTQKETPATNGFSFSKPSEPTSSETTPAAKDFTPTNVFGTATTSGNPFGKPSNAPVSFFGPGSTTKSETLSSGASPFGVPSSNNPFAKTETSGSALDKPAPSTNVFGSTSTAKAPAFGNFTFGAPSSGSIGNPVGFGFGSPSTTPDTASTKSTGFSFAQPPQQKTESDKPASEAEGGEGGNGENATEKKPENASGLSIRNPHDEEGEGEEDEETVHVVRVKAHRLKKEGEKGDAGWAELGVGMLRLKKHKNTESRRMLMRNSANGKININFKLYSGLKPSQNKKALTFVGHDEAGISQTYTIRASNEDQVKELKEALDREIAFVKAKEES